MLQKLSKLFTEHPGEQGETYWQHAKFALGVSFHFFISAIFLILHALFPFVCPPKPFELSSTINYLTKKCDNRKADKSGPPYP